MTFRPFAFALFSTAALSASPLINSNSLNGSFEQGDSQTSVTNWQTGFGSGETQRLQNNASNGAWSLVIGQSPGDPNLGAACSTGHSAASGDRFDLSFDWLPKFGWDADDEIRWRLITTSDNTNTGTVAEIASGTVSGFGEGAGYQSATITGISGVTSAHQGKSVWLQFIRGNSSTSEFARVDNVQLSVTSDPTPQYVAHAPEHLAAYLPLNGDLLDYNLQSPSFDANWTTGGGFTDGIIDQQAAAFNGSQSATLEHLLGNDFTLCFWMKSDSSTGIKGILDAAGTSANGIGIHQSGSRIKLTAGPTNATFSNSFLSTGEWHFICAQRHALSGTLRLFVNGVLEAESIAEPGQRDTTLPLTLGALSGGTSPFIGALDDVRIYHSLLDLVSIQQLYQSQGDFDRDTLSDFTEMVAGSDWTTPTQGIAPSRTEIDAASGTVRITFDALASRTYQLQHSASLDAPSWTNVGDPITPDYHGPLSFTEPFIPNRGQFYRVQVTGRGPVREKRPNIVFIYGDDVGYGDVRAYNPQSKIPTPHIDKLSAEGLRFTDGHCTASTCSPSRFSLLTGIFAFRHGVNIIPPTGPLAIPEDMYTLPDMLKDNGYHTAVIGKWHLGLGYGDDSIQWNGEIKPGPLELGFDHCLVIPTTNDRVPSILMQDRNLVDADYHHDAQSGLGSVTVKPLSGDDPVHVHNRDFNAVNQPGSTIHPRSSATPLYPSDGQHSNTFINNIGRIGFFSGGADALWRDEDLGPLFTRKAVDYIKSQDGETPFFLFFASQDIHVPRAPHEMFQGATNLGWRGDAMVQFDWTTGQILQAIKDAGLEENTIVIFSSDNGPVYGDGYTDGSADDFQQGHDANGPLRGEKYDIEEGGTRVPFIVKWPAKITPGTSDALVSQVDLMASIAELLDHPLPDGSAVDSRSTLAALLGSDPVGQAFTVEQDNTGAVKALRVGHMKYVQGRLYDLSKDLTETTDISAQHPDLTQAMAQQLSAIINGNGVRE
ncbi:sulfatase-like hydrolase/transferase [Sulfuriroseicoccus oceanibius]|uniref:Sulfatase-like hydrolase/transferase n=1 Tax=Sulfuriroseicoccus oceanibius TaxID=2707525 RepID=A0A6B3L3X0_9BACT|nr:sulfatase-like hydrolase/transferase [Sulfuriroseicoccus oceanibius]QQL45812.1 sulfatase-like hydrolase/transferase [Sulfuriroseicoccus oceanibius]